MGYKTLTISNVKTVSGKTNMIDIELEPAIVKIQAIQDIKRIKIKPDVKVRTIIKPDVRVKIDPTIDIKVEPEIDVKIDQKIEINEEPVYVPYNSPPEPVGGFEAIQNNVIIPESVIKSGTGGTVVFKVLIDETGKVVEAKLGKSPDFPGYKDAIDAAFAAIQKVQWKPGKQRDKAVAVWVELPIEFEPERKDIK